MLSFWYSIESSRDLSALISVICCSDLTFFDDFWYKVNEIQENKVQMLLDGDLIIYSLLSDFPAIYLLSSPMFLDAFVTLMSASFLLFGGPNSFPVSFTSFASFSLAEPSLIFL